MGTRSVAIARLVALAAALSSFFALAAVDINSASESQLETLPGIGPSKAREIVAERQANGPYKSVDGLTRVKGIGEKTVAGLRDQASVGASVDAPAATPRKSDSPATSNGGESAAPAGRAMPWLLVIAGLIGVAVLGWFIMRRRAASGAASSPPAPQSGAREVMPPPKPNPVQPASARPAGPTPRPAGPVGAPAGMSPKPAAPAASVPPAPAGPKAAGQLAGKASPDDGDAGSAAPPAPAGFKRKDG